MPFPRAAGGSPRLSVVSPTPAGSRSTLPGSAAAISGLRRIVPVSSPSCQAPGR